MTAATGDAVPSWQRPLGALATAAYFATMVTVTIRSYTAPTYEFDPGWLYTCAGVSGALMIAVLRWRPITRVHFVLAGVFIALGFLSYPCTSRDPFKYLFDGALIRLRHLSPSTHAASQFPIDQYSAVFQDTYWFRLPTPYGPVWQSMMTAVNLLSQNELARGMTLLRAVDSLALVACAYLISAISKRRWLGYSFLVNPVSLLNSAFTPHADVVIAACLLAAYHHRRMVARGLLLAIAALIKPHALVVLPFIEREWRKAIPLWVTAAAFVALLGLLVQPLIGASLREATLSGVMASYEGNYSYLLKPLLPHSTPELVASISFLVFAGSYGLTYWLFRRGRLSSAEGMAMGTGLVVMLLLGLVYPWHFLIPFAFLYLTPDGTASTVVLVSSVLAFRAPVKMLRFTLAACAAVGAEEAISRTMAGTRIVQWWTQDDAKPRVRDRLDATKHVAQRAGPTR